MPAVFSWHHRVKQDEIDELGHANNAAYLLWMQAAAIAHSTEQGWPTDRYRSEGVAWVARSHSIEYLRPAFEGDELKVLTWVADMRKISSRRRYRIRRLDDSPVAMAETNWVFVDLESRRPRRIPPEVAGAFDIVDPGGRGNS